MLVRSILKLQRATWTEKTGGIWTVVKWFVSLTKHFWRRYERTATMVLLMNCWGATIWLLLSLSETGLGEACYDKSISLQTLWRYCDHGLITSRHPDHRRIQVDLCLTLLLTTWTCDNKNPSLSVWAYMTTFHRHKHREYNLNTGVLVIRLYPSLVVNFI